MKQPCQYVTFRAQFEQYMPIILWRALFCDPSLVV